MPKIIKNIIFTIAIFFSFFSYSEESVNIDCGIENNEVKAFDYTICKEDLSFRIFYELFPDIWEDNVFSLFNFDDLSNLKDDPFFLQNIQNLKFSILFQEIFKVFIGISLIIIMVIVIASVIIAIFKSIDNGDFLGQDWKSSSIIKSSFLSAILLTPFNGVYIIHVFILMLATASISLANYTYGYYLSTMESFSNISYEKELSDMDIDKMKGHNKFYSYEYINNLSKIEVCKNRTTQYQIEKIGSFVNSFNMDVIRSCLSQDINKATVFNEYNQSYNNFDKDTYSFFNYNFVNSSSEKAIEDQGIKKQIANGVNFTSSYFENCPSNDIETFSCGEIQVLTPNLVNNKIVSYFLGDYFNTHIENITTQLDYNYPEQNYETIKSGWETLYQEALNKIKEYNENEKDSVSKSIDGKYIFTVRVLDENDLSAFKILSYDYHQLIQNYFFIGYAELKSTDEVNFKGKYSVKINTEKKFTSGTNVSNFISFYNEIKELSKIGEEYHCLKYSEGLISSQEFLNKINNSLDNDIASNRCISYEENRVFGLNDEGDLYKKEDKKEKLEKLEEDFKNLHKKLSFKLYKNKTVVEESFYDSVKLLSDFSFYKQLRKEGWLSFSSNLMKLNKNENFMNKLKLKLINSISFNVRFGEKMIADELMQGTDTLKDKYKSVINNSNLWSHYKLNRKESGDAVDINKWSKSILNNKQNPFVEGDIGISDYFGILINPFASLKESIGLKDSNYLLDLDTDLVTLCTDDPDSCPIPDTNPFISLNKVGHYFLNTSISYYSFVLTINVARKPFHKNASKDQFSKELGAKSIAGSVTGGKKSKVSGLLGFLFDGFSNVTKILSIVMVVVFIVGLVLSYMIPLLPFVFYITAFISWFLLVIQMMFVSPIWAAYLVHINDNKKEIKDFSYNYGLQILLKPFFMVISLIFIWSFYSIVVFFINLTIFPLIGSLHMDGVILSIISSIIIVFLLSYVLFVITKRVFEIFNTLYEKIFELFGVNSSSDDSSTSGNILNSLTGSDLAQLFLGYAVYQNMKDKLEGINAGDSIKKTRLKAKKFADNRIKLFEKLKANNNNQDPKNKVGINELIEQYQEIVENSPHIYGNFKSDIFMEKIK